MQHAHYALQALLYTVALHRYLRWRLPGYDPERNLAGVLYLFLRGMVGADTPAVDGTPCGVFAWRPPAALVEDLSDVLDRRCDVSAIEVDPFDVRRASNAHRPAARLQRRRRARRRRRPRRAAARRASADEDDEQVALAAALAVRGPRLGHVYVDLATIRETATVDADEAVDLSALAWPPVAEWTERLEASALVAVGEENRESRPLRLVGTSLYLDRYWREERQVAADLQALGAAPPGDVDDDVLAEGLARLFPSVDDDRQRQAQRVRRPAPLRGRRRRARHRQDDDRRPDRRAAGRAGRGGRQRRRRSSPSPRRPARPPPAWRRPSTRRRPGSTSSDAVRAQLLAAQASTLHRLLGWRPDSHSRFRHHRGNRLPHDVVIVDETSMVSLSLMARLVEAVRPQARLVLVGDPGQLTSIEAGAVLGDIVGPRRRLAWRPAAALAVTGPSCRRPPSGRRGRRRHRRARPRPPLRGGIATLAEAIRRGDADDDRGARRRAGRGDVARRSTPTPRRPGPGPRRRRRRRPRRDRRGPRRRRAAARSRPSPASASCARTAAGPTAWRPGPTGSSAGSPTEVEGFGAEGQWYVGRPLLVTENDYGLRLYNGDTGVVVATAPGA